jgi:large subunit ribosomal protein L31
MKKEIHPNYRKVAFRDTNTAKIFIMGSTKSTKKTIEVDGTEYPLIDCATTSDSHPFFQGENTGFVDAAGRISKFQSKYARFEKK